MRRSNRTTSGGGSGYPSRHHGQRSRRGQRNAHRASVPFDPYNEASNMEQGMASYNSSHEGSGMESNLMHRRSRGHEDLYRQSPYE